MKCIIILATLACLVLTIQAEWCSTSADCGEGRCCSGSTFNRHCRELAEDGTPCQPPNNAGSYSYGCPCKEGLICSPIRYCQTPY